MKAIKHTPGPWRVGSHVGAIDGPTPYQVYVDSATLADGSLRTPAIIARTVTDDWREMDGPIADECRENARLISLVPAMIRGIVAALPVLEEWLRYMDDNGGSTLAEIEENYTGRSRAVEATELARALAASIGSRYFDDGGSE